MAEFKSIGCPKKEDHKNPKNLLFVGKDCLYAFCKEHFWIKLIFKKGKETINFDGTAVIAESIGGDFHFDHEPMPVLALGEFNLKRKVRDKRYAKSK